VKAHLRKTLGSVAAACVCLGLTACGNKVEGHTYAANGDVVKIEFQSGGKAFTSLGAMSAPCTYTQNGNQVSLVCEGDTTAFTLASDGSLSGPPDGMMARLTKVK
jgi:hypothetical protein